MGNTRESAHNKPFTRRRFLTSSANFIFASGFSQLIHANTEVSSERTLEFVNLHTDETLNCCYWANGKYNLNALSEINYVLRDHRANEAYEINTDLLDLLYVLHQSTGSQAPFHVISAYRSPKTNEKLRKQGSGVAKRSMHMSGKAIDIRLPDVKLKDLRDKAFSLHAGGVGYYAKSNFIHIDIGRPRSW